MSPDFELHERLVADCHELARLALSRVLLMDDANFPWLILVPERPGLGHLHDLADDDLEAMIREVTRASRVLEQLFEPDKVNVAALGNLVPQLHVHVIARFAADPAWPNPVWGAVARRPYGSDLLAERLAALRAAFASSPG
jgi:diadenosine tetraphosphate (Ap4A) HIT family hydrolase